jgi:hypothetical protein
MTYSLLDVTELYFIETNCQSVLFNQISLFEGEGGERRKRVLAVKSVKVYLLSAVVATNTLSLYETAPSMRELLFNQISLFEGEGGERRKRVLDAIVT